MTQRTEQQLADYAIAVDLTENLFSPLAHERRAASCQAIADAIGTAREEGRAAGRKLAEACRALIEEFRTPEIMGKIAPTGSKLDRQRQALTIGEESLAEWNQLTEGKP